jgi:hypothetical protein
MRVPQVNERVKEAPAHALRAMFASIGQLLLFTDRLRSKTADETTTEETTVPAQAAAPKTEQAQDVSTPAAAPAETSTPEASAPEAPEAAAPEAAAPEAPEAVTPDAVTTEAAAPEAEAAPAEAAPVAEAAAVTEAADAALAEAKAEADSKVEAVEAAELPLPNYDELTIPSLRARLRNLSIPQLNQLIGYEQAHANRSEVIAMFERRLAKLAEG